MSLSENPYIQAVNRTIHGQNYPDDAVETIAVEGPKYEQTLFELRLSTERARVDTRYVVHPNLRRKARYYGRVMNMLQQDGSRGIKDLAKRRAAERLNQTLYRR